MPLSNSEEQVGQDFPHASLERIDSDDWSAWLTSLQPRRLAMHQFFDLVIPLVNSSINTHYSISTALWQGTE